MLLPHSARSGSQQRMLARGVEGDERLPHTARSGSQQRMLARGVEGDERREAGDLELLTGIRCFSLSAHFCWLWQQAQGTLEGSVEVQRQRWL